MSDKAQVPKGSVMKPVDKHIDVLLDKHKTTDRKELMEEYRKACENLMQIEQTLRELSVIDSYKNSNETQQRLNREFDNNIDAFKGKAGLNNIILMLALEEVEEFETAIDFENKPYSFAFFKDNESVIRYLENLSEEACQTAFVAPLFISF